MKRLGRPERPMEMERLERPKRLVGVRRLLGPVRLDFFPRSGISVSGLPASSAGCPDYRGDVLLFFPENWRCPSRLTVRYGRSGSAWSVPRRFCVTECRTACMLCCFGMSLQCCVSGSSHCDEMPRLEKLGPGRELFGAAVWILEIKRSELRAWTERDQRRAEYSESLMVECGTVNHVLAGLPLGAPEGAELVGEDVRERERERDRLILLRVLVLLILILTRLLFL